MKTWDNNKILYLYDSNKYNKKIKYIHLFKV